MDDAQLDELRRRGRLAACRRRRVNLPIDAAAARDREISERTKGYAAGWSYRCPCGLQVSQLPEWDDVARLHDRHGRRCELAAAASDPKPR